MVRVLFISFLPPKSFPKSLATRPLHNLEERLQANGQSFLGPFEMKLRLALAVEWNRLEHIPHVPDPYKVHFLPTALAPAPAGLPAEEKQYAFCFDRDPCTSLSGHLASAIGMVEPLCCVRGGWSTDLARV